ncbi:MAG: hypothetical protein ACXVDH_02665 [Nocardioides sp.]|uniref:hypothetical protein n=1 Tax=Nocardioides nematodiphilus TaxID=2849669 RepID=UPI001CD973D9|nr:hypothetical protein [Nocardioides nematodiphilus]MCA1981776.1 hypothetical protein [Nocardioides nematodiphilus]
MENTTPIEPIALDRTTLQQSSLRDRHASALAKLMEERDDLRGTYAFADMVDDSLRWSA